jgi:hypothetical protein
MPTEGSDVLNRLQAALRTAGESLAKYDADASAVDAQARDLVARRGEALLELARHFLPEITRPAIQSTFEGIRGDLTAILARKESRQRDLRDRLSAAEDAARRLDAETDAVTARLNAKVAGRAALEAKVAETLKADADFQGRSKLALDAEQRLHRDELRVAEVQKEAAEKLPRYDRSKVFLYLYGRKFATPEYRGEGLVKSLDRWVAGLIKFTDARAGYDFLKRTPDLVAAEVARRRDTFHELMAQVAALQKEAADKAGLTAVLTEGDALGTQRDALVAQRDDLRKQAQILQQGLGELDRSQNAFYAEAVERFRAFLADTKLALIERRAKQTPEPDDDAIVAEVGRLDGRLDEIKPRLVELADRRQAADRAREGIERVIGRYRKANFDSDRSYFEDPFDPSRALADFDAGRSDANALWETLDAAQRFRPRWIESTTKGAVEAATSPAGRVILGAILDVATTAAQASAHRGVRRHSEASAWSPPPHDAGPASSSSSEGSFTTGEGF